MPIRVNEVLHYGPPGGDLSVFESEAGPVLLQSMVRLVKPSVLHKLLGPKIALFFHCLGFEMTRMNLGMKDDNLLVEYCLTVPVEMLDQMEDPYDPEAGIVTPFIKRRVDGKRKKVKRASPRGGGYRRKK